MTEPTNKNLFQLSKGELVFSQIPNVSFFLKSFNIPGVSVGFVEVPTQFSNVPYPGDSISYEDFSINFLLDEDFETISELHNWMIKNNKRDNDEQFNLEESVSTATLLLKTNNLTKNNKLEFTHIFPISMSSIDIDYSTTDDSEPLVISALFKYQKWDLVRDIN